MIKNIILNRNMLLVMAIVLGLFLPKYSLILAPYTFWLLALVMLFSLSGLSAKSLFPIRSVIKPMLMGVLLNHIIFGIVVLAAALLFFDYGSPIFIGFVIIAATPPGVAIIPFTVKLNGDLNKAIIGTFSAFMASVFLAPLIIETFAGNEGVNPMELLKVMLLLIVLPFAASRLLRMKKILPTVEKTRGSIIDIGFSLIIYASIGVNNHVFFSDFDVLLKIIIVLFIAMFVVSLLLKFILKSKYPSGYIVSTRLLYSIKSSGFAVVTAMELFGGDAAIPATVMSILVLVYFFSLLLEQRIFQQ